MKEADLSKALEAVFLHVTALRKDLEDLGVDVQVLITGEARGGPGSGVAVISVELEDLEASG